MGKTKKNLPKETTSKFEKSGKISKTYKAPNTKKVSEILKQGKAQLKPLKGVEPEIKSKIVDLKSTKKELKSTKADFKQTKANLKSTKVDLKPAKVDLKSTKANLKQSNSLVEETQITKGLGALQQLLEKKKKEKSILFDDEQTIYLQVTTIKVPKTPNRILHLPIVFPVLPDEPEICLITPDLKGKDPKDYDKVVEHYEDILHTKNVTNIKKIIPLHQLMHEYDQFELKRRLAELYDLFLVDGKISGKVFSFLGKIFHKKKKMPTCVKLDCGDLRKNVEVAMKKTSMHIHSQGDNFVAGVGHTKMNQKNVVKNTISVVNGLKNSFPGGWENIKGLFLKSATSTSIPIYYTLARNADVLVPVIKSKKPRGFNLEEDEVTTEDTGNVIVMPSGKVLSHNNLNKRKQTDLNETEKPAKVQKIQTKTTEEGSSFNESKDEDSSEDGDDAEDQIKHDSKDDGNLEDEEEDDSEDDLLEDEDEGTVTTKVTKGNKNKALEKEHKLTAKDKMQLKSKEKVKKRKGEMHTSSTLQLADNKENEKQVKTKGSKKQMKAKENEKQVKSKEHEKQMTTKESKKQMKIKEASSEQMEKEIKKLEEEGRKLVKQTKKMEKENQKKKNIINKLLNEKSNETSFLEETFVQDIAPKKNNKKKGKKASF